MSQLDMNRPLKTVASSASSADRTSMAPGKLTRRLVGAGALATVAVGGLALIAGKGTKASSGPQPLRLSQKELDERMNVWTSPVMTKFTAEEIAPGELERAMLGLGLSFADANALRFNLDDGTRRVGFFHAWDPDGNRGSKASFSTFGNTTTVDLTSSPTKVYVLLSKVGTETMMLINTLSRQMSVGMGFRNGQIVTPFRESPDDFRKSVW